MIKCGKIQADNRRFSYPPVSSNLGYEPELRSES